MKQLNSQDNKYHSYIWKWKNPDEIIKNKPIKNKSEDIVLKDDEIFKKIGILENHDFSNYSVSDNAHIRNDTTKKVIKPYKRIDDYMGIHMTDKNDMKAKSILIHRLVASIFLTNDDKEHKTYVNHMDRNRQNNNKDNLEWITPKGNAQHAGSRKINQIDKETGKIIKTFNSSADIGRELGINKSRISDTLRIGRSYSHGFLWSYAD